MTAKPGPAWIDRLIAWLSAALLGPVPVARAIRIERELDRLDAAWRAARARGY